MDKESEIIDDLIKNRINIYLIFDSEKTKGKESRKFTDKDLSSEVDDSNIFYLEDELPPALLNSTDNDYGTLSFMRQTYPNIESLKNSQLDDKVRNVYLEKLGERMTRRSSLNEPDASSEKVKSVLAKRRAHHEEVAKQARKLKLAILNSINSLLSVVDSGDFVYQVIDPEESETAFYQNNYNYQNPGRDYTAYRLKKYGRDIHGPFDYSPVIEDYNFSLLEKLYIVSRPVNIIFSNQLEMIERLKDVAYGDDISAVIEKDLLDKSLILFEESLRWDVFEYNDNPLPDVEVINETIGKILSDRNSDIYPHKSLRNSNSIFREMKSALSKLDTLINKGGLEIPTFSNLENGSLENSYSQIGIDESMKLTETKIRKIIRESIKNSAIIAALNAMIVKDTGTPVSAILYAERHGLIGDPDLKIYNIIDLNGGIFMRNVSYNEAIKILEPCYNYKIKEKGLSRNFIIKNKKQDCI